MTPKQVISLSSLRKRDSEASDAYPHHDRQLHEFDSDEQLDRLSCLPPVDTGKHAYLFLLACFVLSALVWSK